MEELSPGSLSLLHSQNGHMIPFVGMFFHQRWLLTWLFSHCWELGQVCPVNTPLREKVQKGLVTQHGLSDLSNKSPFLSSALTSAQHLGPQGRGWR